jgi:hypothetical protein
MRSLIRSPNRRVQAASGHIETDRIQWAAGKEPPPEESPTLTSELPSLPRDRGNRSRLVGARAGLRCEMWDQQVGIVGVALANSDNPMIVRSAENVLALSSVGV